MAKNPYFLDSTSEQRLIEDLTKETIRAMGRDVYYIPRVNFNKDYLFGEDPVVKFKGAYEIEMYVKSVGGFEGQGDIISKFGIEIRDRVELVVSRKRFEDLISRVNTNLPRPREGDLIYFPLSDTLFEINFVEHENPFYPLGKRHTYVLSCEAFSYSHEKFETNQSFIDDLQTEQHTNAFQIGIGFSGDTAGYNIGETVYQIIGNTAGDSYSLANADATGEVFDWNPNGGNILLVGNTAGAFDLQVGEFIYGVSSGMTGHITSVVSSSVKIPTKAGTTLDLFDGTQLEKDKTNLNIFDFTDKDPFSEGNY